MSKPALEAHVLRPRVQRSSAFLADIRVVDDVIYLVGGTRHEPTLLASTDAASFHRKKTPDTPGLRSLLALPDGRLVVSGEYGALQVSSDRGDSWTPIDLETRACLFAVVRDAKGQLWVAGDDGFVRRSTDDGATWSAFDAGTTARILNLHADGDTLWFTCGDGALVSLRDDQLRTHFTGKGPLTDVLRTPRGLFVCGDHGELRRSDDDGETFTVLEAVASNVDLEAFAFTDETLFVVGSRGTVLRSHDGEKFESVDTGARDHFFSALATGRGLFVGGEGGCLLHVRSSDDETWANRSDTIADAAGELDAIFLDGDPDTFLTTGLVKLVGGVADGPYPGADAYEEMWGTKMPDELGAMLKAIEKGAGDVLYEWRPEAGIYEYPDDGETNLFEQLVLRDQANYLGTSLVEALAGQFYLGTYGNGDSHLAAIYGDDALAKQQEPTPPGGRRMHIFDHEEHSLSFETGLSVSRFAYFSALVNAMNEQTISERAARTCMERVSTTIQPSWHFRSTLEEAELEVSYEDDVPYGRVWYARGLWIVYLLRADGVVDVEDTKRMFFPGHNPPLVGDVHERWTKSSQRLVPTALYCMLRGFFFEDPTLEEYLAIGRKHRSRLARDCARLIDDTLAGKRKKLGKIEDLLALRTRFQKLDLDPNREEQRKAEAAERARKIAEARAQAKERAMSLPAPVDAAWANLEDLPMHEAIESRLRGEPSLAATFAAVDFVLGQKFVRENLVLDHEKQEELEWLGLHGDPSVLPLLMGTLVRPRVEAAEGEAAEESDAKPISITAAHPNSCGEILAAFASRERFDRRALPELRKMLDVKEKYEWRRCRAVALLGHLRDTESVPKLIAIFEGLATNDFGEAIRFKDLAVEIARAFERLGDARAIDPLAKMLARGDDRVAKDARSYVAEALATLGATASWPDMVSAAATSDRKPAAWLLWTAGRLGAHADETTKQAMVKALQAFEPKWSSFYVELVRDGVLARLGAPPETFAASLERAFTKPAYDAETTTLQETWALRVLGVTDASVAPVKPYLRRDHAGLRAAAREALERRGENVPPARLLHRAEVARLEKEGGVHAVIAAFVDETAIYRHVAAGRLGELKAEAARDALIRYAREIAAQTPRELGASLERDRRYPLRWTLKALLEMPPTSEVIALLGELLVHPSRDVKDPVLRYAGVEDGLPDDPGLIEPMLRVAEEKWGWQESTANGWLEGAKARHPTAYQETLERMRRPS